MARRKQPGKAGKDDDHQPVTRPDRLAKASWLRPPVPYRDFPNLEEAIRRQQRGEDLPNLERLSRAFDRRRGVVARGGVVRVRRDGGA